MATNIELRFDPNSGTWRYWDDVLNQFASPQPTDPADDNLVVLNGDVPDGEFYNAGAGSDTYLVESDYDQTVTITDTFRDTDADTFNIVRFSSDLDITSTEVVDLGLLGRNLQVTLTSGNVITVTNLGTFRFEVTEGEALTADDFAARYATTFAGDGPVFDEIDPDAFTIADGAINGANVGVPVTATDPDGDTITYALTAITAPPGVMALLDDFAIDANGQISFISGINDFSPGETFTITVSATSNGAGGAPETVFQDVTFTVFSGTPMDAVFEPIMGEYTLFTSDNGLTTPVEIGAPITATDENLDEITYGVDDISFAAGFRIDATTGQLSYAGPPNQFQIPGQAVAVTVTATSIGTTNAPVTVQTTVQVFMETPFVIGGGDADAVDEPTAVTDLFIDTGDGNDDIVTGLGDDTIRGGAGDDTIDISAGGQDRVAMTVSSEGAAVDGGDEVTGFETGGDILQFERVAGDVYAGGEPTTTAEWLAYLTGADDIALNGDDLMIVSPIVGFDAGTPIVTGLRFHLREGGQSNGGQSASSSSTEVVFTTPLSVDEFMTAIGGETNYDSDIMAIIDLEAGLPGLLGRDGIRFGATMPVKTTLTHADIVQALADDEDIWNWDVSAVTDMQGIFYDESGTNTDVMEFNRDIRDWDVSNVQTLHSAFRGLTLFNQDLGNWNTGNVENFFRVFMDATSFNGDISQWDTSSATNLHSTFLGARSFNQNIGQWDVSSVTHLTSTFGEARVFNQDIGDWDTSSLTNTFGTFANAWFFNQDISGWDVSSVTIMTNMFFSARSFNQDLGDWDISSLTEASGFFNDARVLSVENLDATLLGWSDLDLAGGEAAIQRDVTFGADGRTYSDATAVNHLETAYGWTLEGMTLANTVWVGTDAAGEDYTADELETDVVHYHALGGDDIIRGTVKNEHFYGGAGDDVHVLGGGGGSIDTVHLRYTTDGNDAVAGFLAGNDMIDISVLLDGYVEGVSDINNYVTAAVDPADSRDTIFSIDANGDGSGADVTIQLAFVTFEATIVDDFVANGSLILV